MRIRDESVIRILFLSGSRSVSSGELSSCSVDVAASRYLGIPDGSEVSETDVTGEQLVALPVGSIVKLDDEEGEIIQTGLETRIIWPDSGVTQIIYTDSKAWEKFINFLEAE